MTTVGSMQELKEGLKRDAMTLATWAFFGGCAVGAVAMGACIAWVLS